MPEDQGIAALVWAVYGLQTRRRRAALPLAPSYAADDLGCTISTRPFAEVVDGRSVGIGDCNDDDDDGVHQLYLPRSRTWSVSISWKSMMQYDVFIGYSRQDSVIAETIQAYLQDAGLSCFRDATNIAGSEEWLSVITTAIRDSHVYLSIVSRNSLASDYVGRELAFATHHKKSYVPVILERGVELPDVIRFHLGVIQHIVADPSVTAVLPQIELATAVAVDREKHQAEWADRKDVLDRANYGQSIDFAVNGFGLTSFQNRSGIGAIEGGRYVLSSQPDEYLGARLRDLPVTSEFVLEVGLRHSAGSPEQWHGIEFGNEYPGDYFQFLLNGHGSVHISKHFGKTWSDLMRREGLRHVQPSGAKNQLTVVKQNGTIHIFVNNLHAVSVHDSDIRMGCPGLVVGHGTRVEFSDLRIDGVSLEITFNKALNLWNEIETKKAKEIFEYVVRYDAHLNGADDMLRQFRPDRNETVLIAIGSRMMPQLHDREPAERIRDAINKKGRPFPFRCAVIVTDTALLEEPVYMRCPVISVGGAATNRFTERLGEAQQEDPRSSSDLHIQRGTRLEERHIAVWGTDAEDTAAAVEMFTTSELLDEFLTSIWSS